MASGWWTAGWIWATTGWTLRALGVVLLVWALFWDRSRGRKRCPKCWYDMSGAVAANAAGPWVCPECGRQVIRLRHLRKIRRRCGWATLALGLLLIPPGVDSARTIRDGSWPNRIPTWLLVRYWPIDERAWFEGTANGRAVKELEARLSRNWADFGSPEACFPPRSGLPYPWMSDDDARVWALRVRDALNAEAVRSGVSRRAAVIDPCPLIPKTAPSGEAWIASRDASQVVLERLCAHVAPMSWEINGGDEGTMRVAGVHLIVWATPQLLSELETAIQSPTLELGPVPDVD